MGRVTRILKASAEQSSQRAHGRAEPRGPGNDPDLARVLASWPSLPQHIKRTILTLISASAVRSE